MAGLGRPMARLVVAPSERETLERWMRRRKTAQGLALRAQIVLRCATGRTNMVVAQDLGVTHQTVGKWRARFVERRLDGLLDEPRPGTARRLSDAKIDAIVVKTLECHGESKCPHLWEAKSPHPRVHSAASVV